MILEHNIWLRTEKKRRQLKIKTLIRDFNFWAHLFNILLKIDCKHGKYRKNRIHIF